MGFAEGVVWSLLGAVAHTIIDVLRKFAAQKLPPADLIALLTIYNAVFAVLGVWLIDGGLPRAEDMPNLPLFIKAAVSTACTGLVAAVLYQRALSIAPLSLTVPYLAFAPVFVVFVSPMFLVGEVPSAMGLCGVAVVSLAGYKLGLLGAADTAALSQQAGKTKQLPLLPTGAKGSTGSAASADHEHHQQLIPAAELRSWEADHSTAGAAVQSRPYQRQPAQLVPPQAGSPELHTGVNGTTTSSSGVSAAQSLGGVDAHQQQQQLGGLHSVGTSHRSSSSNGGGGRLKQKSAWAIAYYKQKSPPLGVWEAACGGLQSAAQQLLGAGMSPRSSAAASAAHNVFGVGSSNGHHMLPSSSLGGGGGVSSEGVNGSGVLSSSDSAGSTSSSSLSTGGSNVVWVDSQAKGSKDPKLLSELSTKRGGVGASGGANGSSGSGGVFPPPRKRRWMRRLSWLRAPWLRLARAVAGPAKLLSGPTAGPALVLIVAFLYSLTASMDKLGMGASASTAFYIMVQRLLIASASSVYLLCGSPRTLRHLYSDALLLVSMSLVEQAAVVLYFKAIQNILVSYMVAIKRINVLLSTLLGCVMFNERVGRRMPYILLMLVGMLLIVLQPGHEALHHSHHTR